MDLKDVLINASNLHVGGGVQVATSFINEASKYRGISNKISVISSTKVDENLRSIGCDFTKFKNYKVRDVRGFRFGDLKFYRELNRFDTVFTIFGPLYSWKKSFISIVGFAQPWIIYPSNECLKTLSFLDIWRTRFKYWTQGVFFKRADALVVELDHVKDGVVQHLGIQRDKVHVVSNCLSSVYHDPKVWKQVSLPHLDGELRLGFLGRNYSHKNTAIFPAISNELRRTYNIKVKFFVTFTESEWQACSPAFREVSINIGPLRVDQCPAFYKALDAVVFPSLLECFSATPLEAMAMEKPLIASDRPFNRDVCQEHAHYFDPLSPISAARAIAQVFANGGPDKAALHAARTHAFKFFSAKQRAEKYLALLIQGMETNND